MANTLNPDRIIDDFRDQTNDSLARFDQLIDAIGNNSASLDLRRALASDSAFKVGSLWEVFQHKWHVAAISKSPSVLTARIQSELDDALRKGAASHILTSLQPAALQVPQRLKVSEIESLLDPDGYNLSFKDCEVWARRAGTDLHPVHANLVRGVVQDAESASLIALLKALRNALAHSSPGSMATLNDAARLRPPAGGAGLAGTANAPLVRDSNRIRDIGTYLFAWIPASQTRRIALLHRRIIEVAERLRVP